MLFTYKKVLIVMQKRVPESLTTVVFAINRFTG